MADDTEAHAGYLMCELEAISKVNPQLLLDLIYGKTTFKEALAVMASLDVIVTQAQEGER